MLVPGAVQGEVHRVDRELVEELEQVVGDEIDGFDQEVAAAHRRVEHPQVEELLHQVLVGVVGLQPGPLAVVHRAALDLLAGVRLRLLEFVVEGLADLAELGPQRFQLLLQHRPDRVGHDVLDDGVGRVVRTRRLALGLVVGEVDLLLPHDDVGLLAPLGLGLRERDVRLALLVGLGREVFVGDLQLELQQALVDRPQVPDFQRFVVDEDEGQRPLVLVPGEPVDGQGQVAIGHLVLQEEAGDALVPPIRLVRRRVEQAAVVGRHVQDRVALVHRREQLGRAGRRAPSPSGSRLCCSRSATSLSATPPCRRSPP